MNKNESIMIVGAGVSGTYLARLFKDEGIKFTLYDKSKNRGHMCAWGTHYSLLLKKLMPIGGRIGIADDYVTCWLRKCYLNGIKIELKNSVIIDKPKLLDDMRSGVKINYRNVDVLKPRKQMVVNATSKLTVMPLTGKVFCIPTYQEKVKTQQLEKETAYIHIDFSKAGYAWAFPLDEKGNLFHIGAGAWNYNKGELINGLLKRYEIKREIICSCARDINVFKSLSPIVVGNVVSIGEAAGCVHPITGEGILPSMDTVEYLLSSLKDNTFPLGYVDKIEKLQDSYNGAWRAVRLMKKFPRLGWISGLSCDLKRAKRRSMPVITKRDMGGIMWNWIEQLFGAI